MILKRISLGVLCSLYLAGVATAQGTGKSIEFRVDRPSQQLEMVVNTSRILTLDKEVPRVLVNNQDVISAYPLSPSTVQISAQKAGVTTVNLWDDDGELYSVDVIVIGDARELELLLKTQFPQASLRVTPISSSVILAGRVDRPESVNRIIQIAEAFYPKVINNITVGGVQQVLLHVKVMEVSRTKLRSLGIDWANVGDSSVIEQSVSGLITGIGEGGRTVQTSGGETLALGIFSQSNSFFLVLEALADNNLAKIMAEPKLVTVSGRPASFNAGGEFPILVPQSLGTIGVEYKQFGTRVDFVPIVLGNGHIRLEVRPQVSELDAANGVTINSERVPALRTRWVDTAVEMRAGQTLALAGLIQTRLETQRRQIPWLGDLPWAGAAFRKVTESVNEIELVVTVRPELVDALEPHEVPACLPGERTTSPNDCELYGRGYIEVPKCCPDGSCQDCQNGVSNGPTMQYEVPMGTEAPNGSPEPEALPSTEVAPIENASRRGTPFRKVSRPTQNRGAATNGSPRQPYIRNNSTSKFRSEQKADPGMFGRIGYDVLDYKE